MTYFRIIFTFMEDGNTGMVFAIGVGLLGTQVGVLTAAVLARLTHIHLCI